MNPGRKSVEISPLRSDLRALGSARCWFCFLFRLRKPLGSEFEKRVPENCHLCASCALVCHVYYFFTRGALSFSLDVTILFISQVQYFLHINIILWFDPRDLSFREKQWLT